MLISFATSICDSDRHLFKPVMNPKFRVGDMWEIVTLDNKDQEITDFAEMKNELIDMCKGDWIVNLDCDEKLPTNFINILPEILELNKNIELIQLSRINIVEGITPDYIAYKGWHINHNGWINFPDYQDRIFQRKPEIKWQGKVHERLTGYKTYYQFIPMNHHGLKTYTDISIQHHKSIERQIKQNEQYQAIINSDPDNRSN